MKNRFYDAGEGLAILKKRLYELRGFHQWMPFFLLALIVLSLMLRLSLFDFRSGDFDTFVEPWIDFIQENGGFFALRHNFSDYNMPYLYLLAIAAHLPFSKLFVVKIISIFFDYVLAFGGYSVVFSSTGSRLKAAFSFFAILFLPTVIFNGALWGQCDVIFVSFAVLSIAALLKKQTRMACILFGVALAFKLQAIFLAPLFLLFLSIKKISFREILWIPAVLGIAMIPAFLAGKPVRDLLLVYVKQTKSYDALTLNAPNIYQWLPGDQFFLFERPGLIFGSAIILGIVAILCARPRLATDSPSRILLAAAFFSLFVPFVLPRMHERYFFLADILAILAAITLPRLWPVPLLVVSASFFSYIPFLFRIESVPQVWLAFSNLLALSFLFRELFGLPGPIPIHEKRY